MPEPLQAVLREAPSITNSVDAEIEQAVREHARFVYQIAYAVLRNHADAEDATQETFVSFWRSRQRAATVRDRRAWLARTAWRTALNRKKRAPEISLEEAGRAVRRLRAAGAGADEIAANHQMAMLLDRLIASLPKDLGETLLLSAVGELSSPEISDLVGVPEASVRTRLLRARQILKEKLSRLLEGKDAR